MLPLAAPSALFTFAGAVAMLAIALLTDSQTTALLAGSLLLGLSGVLALTVPLASRLRRQRVEFAWWLGHGDPARAGAGVVAGATFEVRCDVRNRGQTPLRFSQLLPVVPASVRVTGGLHADLLLPARTRTEFHLQMSAAAAGRVVLQGLAVAVP